MSCGPEPATGGRPDGTDLSTAPADLASDHDHDGLTLRWWFVAYAAWLVACVVTLALLLDAEDLSWQRWATQPDRKSVV